MSLAVIFFIVGFALLLGGGRLLVDGASALAGNFGVSPLVVGLTVVAFGTSAPELAVNLLAVTGGNGGISFGNIIGSNIANIGLIIGCAALLRPLTIEGIIIAREIPMMLLASAAALIMAADGFLTGGTDVFSRSDGLLFLLLFAVFLYYTAAEVLRKRQADPLLRQAAGGVDQPALSTLALDLLRIAGGLAALIGGARLSVQGATSIAQLFGISEVIIGLTIVAVGTSLPELVTSITATWKGQTDLAVGNVVGSNIFNLLFIGGTCATAGTIPVPANGMPDLFTMLLFSVILLPIAMTDQRRITRTEGLVLILLYLAYTAWRVLTG